MSIADSIIRVAIVADAKKLQSGFKDADKATGGFLGSAAKAAGGLIAVDKAFEFIGGALDKADQVGDAMSRLKFTIGETNADKLHDMADDFTKMGLAAPDVLSLEGGFADIGTAIGLNKDDITNFADDVIIIADKLHDTDPDNKSTATFVDLIGKAAGGAKKPLKDLGITIDEAEVNARALKDTGKKTADSLTDSEKATARFKIILEKLNPILEDATTGSSDLKDQQAELKAKFDNLTTSIGEAVQGPLADLLDWINKAGDENAWQHAVDGWEMLRQAIGKFAADVASPLARTADLIGDVVAGLGAVNSLPTAGRVTPTGRVIGAPSGGALSGSSVSRSLQYSTERNGINLSNKQFLP